MKKRRKIFFFPHIAFMACFVGYRKSPFFALFLSEAKTLSEKNTRELKKLDISLIREM
jgi:hypothetical protein